MHKAPQKKPHYTQSSRSPTHMTFRLPSRILVGAVNSSSLSPTHQEKKSSSSEMNDNVDSDFVVILAALLCALICVLGLVAVARCAWIRRISDRATARTRTRSSTTTTSAPPPNKGLKKKVLKSLPKLTYSPHHAAKFSDCAICLAEFTTGDEIRVLPQCGHGFHVPCIDTWLGSHSSCPSCRQILVAAKTRCHKCGELPSSAAGADTETGTRQTEDQISRYLP